MAYNYTNPFNYGNPYLQTALGYVPTNTQPANDFIFVLDEAAARSYPVGNGQKATLWDKNNSVFYIKSVDANGIPDFRIFDFTERPQNRIETPQTITDEYVTKTDMEKMFSDFRSSLINELKQRNHNGKPPFKKED